MTRREAADSASRLNADSAMTGSPTKLATEPSVSKSDNTGESSTHHCPVCDHDGECRLAGSLIHCCSYCGTRWMN